MIHSNFLLEQMLKISIKSILLQAKIYLHGINASDSCLPKSTNMIKPEHLFSYCESVMEHLKLENKL